MKIFVCFQCKGDRCVEKAFENYQQSSKTNKISKELENLQEDMLEHNQVLSAVKRRSVKDIILAEINLLSAKIDSLHDQTADNSNRKMTWSEVVAKKRTSPALQFIPRQIPVIDNRYNLLSHNERCTNNETTS